MFPTFPFSAGTCPCIQNKPSPCGCCGCGRIQVLQLSGFSTLLFVTGINLLYIQPGRFPCLGIGPLVFHAVLFEHSDGIRHHNSKIRNNHESSFPDGGSVWEKEMNVLLFVHLPIIIQYGSLICMYSLLCGFRHNGHTNFAREYARLLIAVSFTEV